MWAVEKTVVNQHPSISFRFARTSRARSWPGVGGPGMAAPVEMMVHVHEPGNQELSGEIQDPRTRDVEAGCALDGGNPIASDENSHVALNRAPSHVDHGHVIQHGFLRC